MSLNSKLTAIANAIRAKTGSSEPMSLDDMAAAISGISSGGTDTADGIVFNAVNSQGRPTEVTFCGETLPHAMFGTYSKEAWTPFGFRALTKVNLVGVVSMAPAFQNSEVAEITGLETVENINYPTGDGSCFANAYKLVNITLPKVSSIPNNTFNNCTALESVQVGSVGHPVTSVSTHAFPNCTQEELTITIYTTGAYADTALANIRNGATNATIVIKASEATSYNGTSYAAGESMISSTV